MTSKPSQLARVAVRLAPYKMLTHPGLQFYVRNGLPLDVAQQLARAYGPVNAASPQIMAAGLARIKDMPLFYILLRNLWEECGDGDMAKSHVEMFDRFARSVAVEASHKLPYRSRGEALVDGFLSTCRSDDEHRVLAMFHGFEAVFPYICGQIDAALKTSRMSSEAVAQQLAVISADDANFFPFHAVHDLDHAATTREAMTRSVGDDENKQRDCVWFAERGARLIYDLFDEVFEERRGT